MIVGERVRFVDGMEGIVLHVAIGEYDVNHASATGYVGTTKVTGFLALLKRDNGTLTSRVIEGAIVVERPPIAMPVAASAGKL
jgi:hypothetical protein